MEVSSYHKKCGESLAAWVFRSRIWVFPGDRQCSGNTGNGQEENIERVAGAGVHSARLRGEVREEGGGGLPGVEGRGEELAG